MITNLNYESSARRNPFSSATRPKHGLAHLTDRRPTFTVGAATDANSLITPQYPFRAVADRYAFQD
jgi:hypothetical protein